MNAGGRQRTSIADAIELAKVGVTQRPESMPRQIDDRIVRVFDGRASDEDRRRLANDLARRWARRERASRAS